MRKLPPLNGLKAFEAAARLSSVTAAAEELCVSHSSISQHIKQLEEYFGRKLFVRSGRGLEPTAEAMTYLEDLRTSLDRIALASERLVRQRNQHALTINTTPSLAMRWLIPNAARFQSEHPSIELVTTISKSDAISQLDRPHDFIVRREAMKRADHICTLLLKDEMTPVMSPQLHKRYVRESESPADLLDAPLLSISSRGDAWGSWFIKHGVEIPDTIGGAFFDHFFLSVEAAINSLGVAIVSKVLVKDDLNSGRLIAPFPNLTIDGPGFHLLYHKDIVSRPAGKIFLSWISDNMTVWNN